jgi:hypothetical protein
VPASKKLETKLSQMPLKVIDAKISLDENQKWAKVFDDIIVKQVK